MQHQFKLLRNSQIAIFVLKNFFKLFTINQMPYPRAKISSQIPTLMQHVVPTGQREISNCSTPGTKRLFKCPTHGPAWTIKSPPYALHPPPPTGLTLIGA